MSPIEASNVDKARDLILLTGEYNGARTNLVTNDSQQRNGILRDYSQTGLAILGGALTLFTVGPSLIKTSALMYIGSALILVSVILAFVVRHVITAYLREFLADEAANYFKVVNPAREVMRKPNDPSASAVLDYVTKNEIVSRAKLGWLGEWGDRIVGALLLSGGLCVATSLTLTVAI